MGLNNSQLTTARLLALEPMLSKVEVARRMKISVRTLHLWFKKEEFVEAVDRFRSEMDEIYLSPLSVGWKKPHLRTRDGSRSC